MRFRFHCVTGQWRYGNQHRIRKPRPHEFYTQKWRGAKASPGGEAGSPLGLTDEVEATNHCHRLVQNCNLRPHPSRAVARDTFPSRGRHFYLSGRLLIRVIHPRNAKKTPIHLNGRLFLSRQMRFELATRFPPDRSGGNLTTSRLKLRMRSPVSL